MGTRRQAHDVRGQASSNAAEPPIFSSINEPLEDMLARLFERMEQDGPLGGRHSSLVELLRNGLPGLGRKEKHKVLFTLTEFRRELELAPPEEVRRLAESGFCRVLCECLRNADAETFAKATECLSHCIRIVPELTATVWSFGAVRPITALLLKSWGTVDKQRLIDNAPLQQALYFLATMGRPTYFEELDFSAETRAASKKCLTWVMKMGIRSRVAGILVALFEGGAEGKDADAYLMLVFNGVSFLLFGSHWSLLSKWPEATLENQKGLGAAVLYFIQLAVDPGRIGLEQSEKILGMCSLLLLTLWLHYSNTTDSKALKLRKKEIAEFPGVLQVVHNLKDRAESRTAPAKDVTKACFVALVCLLTCEHPRPLPSATIESAVQLMGDPDIRQRWTSWDRCNILMNHHFHAGTISMDFLLTHFFPGFLLAFASEADRLKPAHVYSPDTRMLFGMAQFLSASLYFSFFPFLWTPDNKNAIVVPRELLPRLVRSMIDTEAAAAVASLAGSATYQTARELCIGMAQVALGESRATLRRLNEQMIPALLRTILDGSEDDEIMRLARVDLLSCCTKHLVPSMQDVRVRGPKWLGGRTNTVLYNFDQNMVELSTDLARQKASAVARFAADTAKGVGNLMDQDFLRDERERLAAFIRDRGVLLRSTTRTVARPRSPRLKEESCASCKILVSKVKQCARCRAKNYCSVACQKMDWPAHKKECKRTD